MNQPPAQAMFALTLEAERPTAVVGQFVEVRGKLTLFGLGVPGLIKVSANGVQVLAFALPISGEYRTSIPIREEGPIDLRAEHPPLIPLAQSPPTGIIGTIGAPTPEEIRRVIPSERVSEYREVIQRIPVVIQAPPEKYVEIVREFVKEVEVLPPEERPPEERPEERLRFGDVVLGSPTASRTEARPGDTITFLLPLTNVGPVVAPLRIEASIIDSRGARVVGLPTRTVTPSLGLETTQSYTSRLPSDIAAGDYGLGVSVFDLLRGTLLAQRDFGYLFRVVRPEVPPPERPELPVLSVDILVREV